MPEVWLVCEGQSDLPVLSGVLEGVLAAEIIVTPAGGKKSVSSVAAYLSEQRKGHAAYVIDRDYQRREECERTFGDGRRCFVWRRHSIESYLLEPAVIVEAIRSLKASLATLPGGVPASLRGLPEDEAVVAEGLRFCGSKRAAQEAGHLTLHRLWEDLQRAPGRVQELTPSVLRGATAPDPAECRRALLEEAARISATAVDTSRSPHLTAAAIAARYDEHLAALTAPDYLATLRFLEDFDGDELLSALLAWLQTEHRATVKRKTLVKELERAVPVAYAANRLVFRTDDFLDLANGVRALAGLAPLS